MHTILICCIPFSIDDEIYADFTETFPEIDVQHLDEQHFKTDAAKAKWRDWINKYEKRVNEYNFGSLIRIDPRDDYTEQNTMFGIRMQVSSQALIWHGLVTCPNMSLFLYLHKVPCSGDRKKQEGTERCCFEEVIEI